MAKTFKQYLKETEEGYNWKPVVRVGRVIPFGYKQDENDRDILLPIPQSVIDANLTREMRQNFGF